MRLIKLGKTKPILDSVPLSTSSISFMYKDSRGNKKNKKNDRELANSMIVSGLIDFASIELTILSTLYLYHTVT